MTSSKRDIEKAFIDAINEDPESRRDLEKIPERVADLVREFTPVLTGETEKSIEVALRKTELKKLSKRKVKLGTVYSTSDPERVGAIEYGRDASDTNGASPEWAMFRRAAAAFENMEL
ncbi:hypothetical protein [Mycobacterium aquaticum]|uniref:Uncharacterized protein n=1 Tax=Mycobacterium aquaticum TaxID=1927124 RepID=A0A1X0B944_9MYCO|nr:hypothetical protein [Mycobacterium aquaticum]ORA38705.1 hypothetical protein BST13_04815 [Mycobacterium aquaticum]